MTAAAMCLLLLVPNGWGLSGRGGILLVIGCTAAIGGALLFLAGRGAPDSPAPAATAS